MSRKIRQKTDGLLALEKGTIKKHHGGRIRVALVYPNTYHVGMSSLGFQGVYGILNGFEDVVCERAFLPDPEDMGEYGRTGLRLSALESGTPLGEFDAIAFSVSFENDYPNIPRILELAGLPVRADQRSDRHPIVSMGGICAMSNPEPLSGFFDLVFVGEAEEIVGDLVRAMRERPTKKEFLEGASGMEGFYVPEFYEESYAPDGTISGRTPKGDAPEKITRRCIRHGRDLGARHVITTPSTEFSDMALVEAMRGCPWGCGFCLAGHVLNPARKKPIDVLMDEIKRAGSGSGRVGLIGSSLSDYPRIGSVLRTEGVEFSITSLRAGKRSDELIGSIRSQKSISIAPEAGTQRLRDLVNKKITEDDILATSSRVLSGGRRLRLYFMVGLPTETDDDAESIAGLVVRIRENCPKGPISVTLSTFVPKPFTPFERQPMQPMRTVRKRMKAIKAALSSVWSVRVFSDVPKYAYLQGMLSLGDRRVGAVLEAMLEVPDWRDAARRAGIDPDFYTLRPKGGDERLPWDFIR